MGLSLSGKVLLENGQHLSATQLFNFLCDFRYFSMILDCSSLECYENSHIDTSIHFTSDLNPLKDSNGAEVLKSKLHKLNAIIFCGSAQSEQEVHIKTAQRLKAKYSIDELAIYQLSCTVEQFGQQYPFLCSNSPKYQHGMLYPSIVENRVYISNLGVATNNDVLNNLGITHVVNCTVEGPFADAVTIPLQPISDTTCLEHDPGDEEISQSITTMEKRQLYTIQHRLRVPVVDDSDVNIQEYFQETTEFIQSALNSPHTSVLIHCKHGQSRSATIVAAWLIAHRGHTAGSAIKHLKACRPRVGPNIGFLKQLEKWEHVHNEGK